MAGLLDRNKTVDWLLTLSLLETDWVVIEECTLFLNKNHSISITKELMKHDYFTAPFVFLLLLDDPLLSKGRMSLELIRYFC